MDVCGYNGIEEKDEILQFVERRHTALIAGVKVWNPNLIDYLLQSLPRRVNFSVALRDDITHY